MRNSNGASPQFWLFVERFYSSHKLYQEQYDLYEGKVANYVERFGKPRHEIRLEPGELSDLLDFKRLERIRDAFLLPLKDASHAFFRSDHSTDFIDRIVNDIFHEISILKEEHYNVLTYTSPDDDLAGEEMRTILDEVHEMFPIKVHRLMHLFDVARGRLEKILPAHKEDVVFIRSLFLNRDGFVAEAYEDGLIQFYRLIYGDDRAFDGFKTVGDSFYHSGFYDQALLGFEAGEEYLQGIAPHHKRRLHSSWKEARDHFKRYGRNCRERIKTREAEEAT